MKLLNYIKKYHTEKKIQLFFDIETFQYNEDAGKKNPSEYKNCMYSLAVSYFDENDLIISHYYNFYDFFEEIKKALADYKTKPNFELIAHNGNKYDNHFMRYELLYYYPQIEVKDLFIEQGIGETNKNAIKQKELSKKEKVNGIILEKRVKSKNNLAMVIYLDNICFETVDNFLKTNVSIKTLGEKLLRLGKVTEQELKTDYNYTKYNLKYDIDFKRAKDYAYKIFKQLNEHERIYINNDVIILANSVRYYSEIFKGFDYSKFTFTQNILAYYDKNNLVSYQLLNKIGKGKEKTHIKYTDYQFKGMNFYDFLKPFYRGGLNFYNDRYLNKLISEPCFAIDLNSSYPYVMHSQKIPTFLIDCKEYLHDTDYKIPIFDENYYYLYQITPNEFNKILSRVKSEVCKKMLVKYYTTISPMININSYTLRILNEELKCNIKSIKIRAYLKYECYHFGGREQISHNYFIKEQGKSEFILNYKSPYEMNETKEINKSPLTKEEIINAKVLLNGLYGIPALRAYFNVFRKDKEEYKNIENGFKNNERNLVFSIFVTSVAIFNLLRPFKDLTPEDIDECYLYCDTDSLYMKKKCEYKIDKGLFDKRALGSYSYDAHLITKFYVLNHKKYCYEKEGKIIVRCGGIPLDSFNKNMSFENFVKSQFSVGRRIKNTRSIYNKQGTISIYETFTELKQGFKYRMYADEKDYIKIQSMLEKIKESLKDNIDDKGNILYIESNLGTFSLSELFYKKHEFDKKFTLEHLKLDQEFMKDRIQKKLLK